MGFLPVPSGASRLLKVGFGRIGQIEVQHDAYIGLVDTHSESVCSYHYTYFPVLPAFLAEVFHGIVQPRVIEIGGNAFVYQKPGDFFRPPSVAHIDNGAALYLSQNAQHLSRSEERRVGKEGRSRWSPYPLKKKNQSKRRLYYT